MRSKQIAVFFVLFWLVATGIYAQTNRYMVFFTDKDTSAYSAEEAEVFLSPRAIARREKQNIAISPEDYPIKSSYVDQVSNLDVDVFFQSKWMNGVLVQMNASKVASVESLGFVTKVERVADNPQLSYTQEEQVIPEELMEPTWGNFTSQKQLSLLNADEMHADGYTGEGMLIAVFDNGFTSANKYKPFEHIYNENRLLATKDFIGNSGNVFKYGSHGTQVFSCIGANYGDTLMVGTAPDASYVLCVTEEGNEYRIEEYNWLLAAEFADSLGVDVINSSLGYSDGFTDQTMDYSKDDLDGKTAVISQAANIATAKGMIVVTSAGNEGTSSWKQITAPADAFDVLTVGSIDKDVTHTSFSSYGPTADGRIKPDVCALGNPATVVNSSGKITGNTGTSFSSPQMAGFAACIWQANPEWDHKTVITAIKNSASNALNPNNVVGYGLPNYRIAVVNGTLSYDQILNSDITVYPNPFKEGRVTIDFHNATIQQPLHIEITNLEGKSFFKKRVTERTVPEQLVIEFEAEDAGVYLLSIENKKFNKIIKLIKI